MNNSPREEDDDIGRRLYAAVVSAKLGVTADYALENFVPIQVDEGWDERQNTRKQPINRCPNLQSYASTTA
jgi:hypothetical protein